MKFKIAVVQFKVVQFSPQLNLEKAENFIKRAKRLRAEIIIFPEDFITGPVIGKKELVDFNNNYLRHFRKLARKYSIDIVSGSWIEGDSRGWYNTSYYIDASGKVRGKYKKINLWLPERRYINPGNEIAVFNTKFGKVGLIICWDLVFPEIFRRMVKMGVNLVFCPSYWLKEDTGIGLKYEKNAEIKSVNSLCVSRAFENNIILVYCNAAGKFRNKTFQGNLIGQSQISVPFKGVFKLLKHNKEEMFIQEIDSTILKDSAKTYKIRDDIKKRILY